MDSGGRGLGSTSIIWASCEPILWEWGLGWRDQTTFPSPVSSVVVEGWVEWGKSKKIYSFSFSSPSLVTSWIMPSIKRENTMCYVLPDGSGLRSNAMHRGWATIGLL